METKSLWQKVGGFELKRETMVWIRKAKLVLRCTCETSDVVMGWIVRSK